MHQLCPIIHKSIEVDSKGVKIIDLCLQCALLSDATRLSQENEDCQRPKVLTVLILLHRPDEALPLKCDAQNLS